jgi:hypothetical protein
MKDAVLYNDILRNTAKGVLLVHIDRNGGKSKEEETWICELERMSIIGTMGTWSIQKILIYLYVFIYQNISPSSSTRNFELTV